MSAGSDGDAPGRGRRVADLLEREPVWAREFTDPRYEWRRWFSELFGTFLLVLAGGGAPVVDTLSQGAIGRVTAVAAPGLTVLAVILFMGAVSGAHLDPVVTIAFSLRADFAWRRVPGYLAAQLVGRWRPRLAPGAVRPARQRGAHAARLRVHARSGVCGRGRVPRKPSRSADLGVDLAAIASPAAALLPVSAACSGLDVDPELLRRPFGAADSPLAIRSARRCRYS
jgi:hypothetical protein